MKEGRWARVLTLVDGNGQPLHDFRDFPKRGTSVFVFRQNSNKYPWLLQDRSWSFRTSELEFLPEEEVNLDDFL